jgi:hypothetical protein
MGETRLFRVMVAGLVSCASLAAVGRAHANTIQFEAESVRDRQRGTITTPLQIKDDPAASGGSYVTVTAGNNSPSTAPTSTTEGVAKYTFSVTDTGTYRIWARVSAPTDADDSFWIRIGATAAWIKWNGIPLGTPYHWVLVKADGAANPATFSLTGNADNQLQIAYREDGAKLDAFFISNDTAFDPNATLTAPPALPVMQPVVNGATAVKLSWSAVPGATSYTIERKSSGCSFNEATQCCESPTPYQVIQSGVTVHKFTDTTAVDNNDYRVTAVAGTGQSAHPIPQGPDNCFPFDISHGNGGFEAYSLRTQVPVLAVTSPMRFASDGGVGAPAGTDSTSAAPAHGMARLDFELAVTTKLRVWAEVLFPNKNQDSFWVRADDSAWINWNNINQFCSDVRDSSKSGSPTVLFNLGPGSHRFEWAYREGGAELLDNIILDEDPTASHGQPCDD